MSLSPLQIRAAQLLARGLTQEETAKQVNVSRRSIVRWLSKEEFKNLSFGLVNSNSHSTIKAEVKPKSRRDNESSYVLEDLVPLAVKTLADVLNDPDTRNADRLKAISLVGDWTGLNSDFNVALASLRRYGLVLCESPDGTWVVRDQRNRYDS